MIKKILITTLLISLIPAQDILADSDPHIEGRWYEGEKSLYWN